MADQPIHYQSVRQLSDALHAKEISASELVDEHVNRINNLDGQVGSYLAVTPQRALEQAAAAQILINGGNASPLTGIPMQLKDNLATRGITTTCSSLMLEHFVPPYDATVTTALADVGAVLLGKGNMDEFAMGSSTETSAYKPTRNPWDLDRVPGGSSGGSAAALAADLTSLELGSDIGGSIRTPAHYCGVYGHKPTLGIIPKIKPLPSPQIQDDLSVVGPLSRSANDLELALSVMAGPEYHHSQAWQLDLPNPRHTSLSDYRVAAWLDDPFFPVDDAVSKRLKMTVEALRSNGIAVDEMARPAIGNFEEVYRIYFSLLMSGTGLEMPHEYLLDLGIREDALGLEQLDIGANRFRSAAVRHRDWLILNQRRHQIRAEWNNFFSEFDIMLMPVTSITAPEHNPIRAAQNDALPIKDSRKILVNGEERSYWEQLGWISMATMAHLPATVAPIGCSESGLPVGIQIIGPYLGDRTTIDFAQKLSELIGGFIPPIPLSNM